MLLIVINLKRNAGDEVQHPQPRHTDICIYIYIYRRTMAETGDKLPSRSR